MSSQVYNEKVPEEAQKNDAETKKALESQVVAYERRYKLFGVNALTPTAS